MLNEFDLSNFTPPDLALPVKPFRSLEPRLTREQIEGTALHGLMERISTDSNLWPLSLPTPVVIAKWLSCSVEVAQTIRLQAQSILQNPDVERFFNPAHFRFARNEMDVVCEGQLLRLDRVVVFEYDVWVLDFKRQLLDQERKKYQQQLAQYCRALRIIYPRHNVSAGLILADGRWVAIELI